MKRPPRKELHWELALKVAVYYNTLKNAIISAESDMVIDYFKKNHGKKFLSPRPKAFDAPDSKLQHEYGVKMTPYSKPRMLSLLQTWVEDNWDVIWFNELILNLIAYDEENIGTDWDDADAVGYALMRIIDMKRDPRDITEGEKEDFDLPQYEVKDGILIDRSAGFKFDPNDPQGHLWVGEKYTQKGKATISDLD
jgi:hypothetical protein